MFSSWIAVGGRVYKTAAPYTSITAPPAPRFESILFLDFPITFIENLIARYFLSDLKISLYLNKSKERQLGICLVSDLTSLPSLISGSAPGQTCFSQLTLIQYHQTIIQGRP